MRPCPPPDPSPSKPAHRLPKLACDAHCHVFGPADRFAYSANRAYTPEDMPKERLFALQDFLGFQRRVMVQASCQGTDNTALLDALRARPETSRGVVALADDATEAEIDEMHAAGVRGMRFNFMSRILRAPEPAAMAPLIAMGAKRGWHVVLHFDADQIRGLRPWIETLELPVVFDHCGRLCAPDHGGRDHDSFCALMERPNMWTKLSGVERGSVAHAPYDDMVPILRTVADIAPDRVMWGTDWPHPVLSTPMPDDGALVDYLWRIIPDPSRRKAALVDNPAHLYDFPEEDT